MNISIKNIGETDCLCDALILPVTEGDSKLYNKLGVSVQSLVKKVFSKEFKGKQNEVLLVPCTQRH